MKQGFLSSASLSCKAFAFFLFQSSGHLAGVHYVGVSHSGIYLIQRVKNMMEDYLDVIEHIK